MLQRGGRGGAWRCPPSHPGRKWLSLAARSHPGGLLLVQEERGVVLEEGGGLAGAGATEGVGVGGGGRGGGGGGVVGGARGQWGGTGGGVVVEGAGGEGGSAAQPAADWEGRLAEEQVGDAGRRLHR